MKGQTQCFGLDSGECNKIKTIHLAKIWALKTRSANMGDQPGDTGTHDKPHKILTT